METSTPSLPARVRLYVTLAYQVVPLLVVLLTANNPDWGALVFAVPVGIAVAGLVMELAGKPAGRVIALTSLGVQALAVLVGIVLIFIKVKPTPTLSGNDAWVIVCALVPLAVFLWNLLAGARKPVGPVDGFSRAPQG